MFLGVRLLEFKLCCFGVCLFWSRIFLLPLFSISSMGKLPATLFFVTLIVILTIQPASSAYAQKFDRSACTFQGKPLFGKVQIVTRFPDAKVKVVSSFEDLAVQTVTTFPDRCGKWQFVTSFPNLKVQFVENFPDLKIRFVDAFPGLRR